MNITPVVQRQLSAAVDTDVMTCDACGCAIDGEPMHFSGTINGVATGHIHLCAICAEPMPLVVVQGGKAAPQRARPNAPGEK